MLVGHTGGGVSSFSYIFLSLAGHSLCEHGIGNSLTICTFSCKIRHIYKGKEPMKNITVTDYQAEINRKLCAANITRDLKRRNK
tara:strand:- start:78 stop:329 length:252 start_codon:yes stop_codon:yes gene_type:complete